MKEAVMRRFVKPTNYSMAALLVLCLSHPASASFDTGNDLYRYCQESTPSEKMLCLGLVTGYLEGMQTAAIECKTMTGVTRGQLKDIVMKFLREHPEDRHLPAAWLATHAYYLAFNCHPGAKPAAGSN